MIDCAGASEVCYYYHFDGLGSVVALSNTSGSIVERYVYDVFGEVTVCDAGGTPRNPNESLYDNPYLFTGRRYDPETGLYYYRARMYNPGLGRFMQPDPIGYNDGMNMYGYVGNNPCCYTDAFGLCKNDPWYKQSWEAVGAFGIGFLEFIYDTEVFAKEAARHPWRSVGEFSLGLQETLYDFEVLLYDTLYDVGSDPSLVTRTTSEFWQMRSNILINELDKATADTYAWGNAWGKISAGAEITVATSVVGAEVAAAIRTGKEFSIGSNLRIAPFGNRTQHKYGRWSHYHRKITDSNGNTVPGGSKKWHRPWEKGW